MRNLGDIATLMRDTMKSNPTGPPRTRRDCQANAGRVT